MRATRFKKGNLCVLEVLLISSIALTDGFLLAGCMRRGGGLAVEEGVLRQEREAEAKAKQAEENARKAAAEADKVAVEAEKTKAEAERAAFSAAFPASEAKAREGTIEIDAKAGFVSDLIAHERMRSAGEHIRDGIGHLLKKKGMRVLLVSSPDLVSSDWPLMAIRSELRRQRKELKRLRGQLREEAPPAEVAERQKADAAGMPPRARGVAPLLAAGTALQAAESVVGGVAEIASLLRADYELHGRDVKIEPSPVLAAVARFLVGKVEQVNVEGFYLLKKSALIEELAVVYRLRVEVETLALAAKASKQVPADRRVEHAKEARAAYVKALAAGKPAEGDKAAKGAELARDSNPVDAASLAPLLEHVKTLEEAVAKDDVALAESRAQTAVAEATIKRFDTFLASIVKPPEDGKKYPPLIVAALRERLHAKKGYTHVLYAGVDAAGGEAISRRGFFKSKMRFTGGANVTYMLWDVKRETLVAADTKPFLAEVKMNLGSGFDGGVKKVGLG